MTDAATATRTELPDGADPSQRTTLVHVLRAWSAVRLMSIALAACVGLVALVALAGWALGWRDLSSWLSGGVQMKVNAALCLLFMSVGLGLRVASQGRDRRWEVAGSILGLAVVALAGATLFEHASGVSIGIDQAFVRDVTSATSPYPGRMAVQTASAFVAAGLGLVALGRTIRGVYVSQILGVAVGIVGGISLMGYMYGASPLLSVGSPQQIALPAAVALTAMAFAMIGADPNHRLVCLVSDPGAAGQVMRVVVPAALLVVPVSAWLRLQGEEVGLYDSRVGLAIMVTVEAIVLAIIGVWATSRVQRLETERSEARRDRDQFFELTNDLVCVAGPDGRLVVASPSWEQTLGYPISEMTSWPFIDFVHPDDRAATLAEFGSELTGKTTVAFQNRYHCADGTYRWLEWHSHADPATGRVFAVARDVSTRKSEEVVLREASLYARGLLEASLDPLVTISPDGKVTDVNEATEAATGLSRQELIGTDFADYFTEPEVAQAGYQKVLRDGLVHDYPLTIRHADGKTMDVLYNATLYRNQAGDIQGVFAAARDVTARKRAETESSEARRRLEANSKELARSNAELEQFAYVASHDLQEPLRMVTGFMGLLKKKYGAALGGEAEEYIGFAVDGARRMQALIDGLLTYSRVGSRGGNPVRVPMGEVARLALANLRELVEETGASVDQMELPTVTADRQQMIQLYQNLIGNAIKFRGQGPPRIELGAERGEREWRLFVRDHGIGIPQEHRDNVFVIFRRLHSRDEYAGSGIGLAICKRIAERHGGRVWVESTAGGGSTFWFTLPDRTRSGEDG